MPSVKSSQGAVRIEGLRELERAFKLYGRGMEKGIREALEVGAEPVRRDAQSAALPVVGLSKLVPPWSQMRVGVTRRTAYVAPARRGTGKARFKQARAFKARLLDRAMEPALGQNISNVEREVAEALNDLARRWSRV
jgi:hypothetical protein